MITLKRFKIIKKNPLDDKLKQIYDMQQARRLEQMGKGIISGKNKGSKTKARNKQFMKHNGNKKPSR